MINFWCIVNNYNLSFIVTYTNSGAYLKFEIFEKLDNYPSKKLIIFCLYSTIYLNFKVWHLPYLPLTDIKLSGPRAFLVLWN